MGEHSPQVCVREWTCVVECVWRPEDSLKRQPSSCTLFETVSLLLTHTYINLATLQAFDALLSGPISPKSSGITDMNYRTWLYVSSGNLNLHTHICTAKAFPTEPSPHSLEND